MSSMRQVLIAAVLVLGVVSAAPAPCFAQDPPPDFKKAAEHYKAAEAAMAAELYLDAAREYAIAYEITRDAVLFFKIATANDKGGKCELAVTYYRRYLKEGKPDEKFRATTEQRIAACQGKAPPAAAEPPPAPPTPTPSPSPTPSPAPTPTPTPTPSPSPSAEAAEPAITTDPAAEPAPAPPEAGPSWKRSAGWISIGVAAAAGTVGAVMALSARSTEQDLDDLMAVREDGRPITFDAETASRYDELVDEGKRFNTLTIVSFGVAGAAAAAAATFFVLDATDTGETAGASALRLAPAVTPDGASVSASWRF
jgi:outer membrane biosynthesis protein TonB